MNTLKAIAEELTKELHTPPNHTWITYQPTNPQHQHLELINKKQPDRITTLRLILTPEHITTNNPKTTAKPTFNYENPDLINQLNQHINNIITLTKTLAHYIY